MTKLIVAFLNFKTAPKKQVVNRNKLKQKKFEMIRITINGCVTTVGVWLCSEMLVISYGLRICEELHNRNLFAPGLCKFK